jgi:predicted Zn-dependent protease
VPDSPRIEELKRRVQSDPASIAFAALAEEYRRAGRFEEAIETCRTGLVRHPSYLSAHVTLGRALIEVGRVQDAREELEFVLTAPTTWRRRDLPSFTIESVKTPGGFDVLYAGDRCLGG